MARPRVHVFAICGNERQILPYFLRHYGAFAERIVVFDDVSDDGSVDILKAHSRVEVRKLPGSGLSREGNRRDIKLHAWKESRRVADWVINCDVDEFLHHTRLLESLADCTVRGVTLPIPAGFQFFAEWFPSTECQIYDELRFGFADPEYDKPLVFDPNAIDEINYSVGCHSANPTGRIVSERSFEIRLLHAKFLGLSYLKKRYRDFATRCIAPDQDQGWDGQCFWDDAELERRWIDYRNQAGPIFSRVSKVSRTLKASKTEFRINEEGKMREAVKKNLAVYIISWNRPNLLRNTLESLFGKLEGLAADVFVIDNGSTADTLDVIEQEARLAGSLLLGENLGINGALERAVPVDAEKQYDCLLVSDADMAYEQALRRGIDLLQQDAGIGAVSYQHSPEHPEIGRYLAFQHEWIVKESERGCALLLRSEDFQRMRPLPVENPKDFDWWVMRDSPNSLAHHSRRVAVLPGGARHLGWRQGDSTWQPDEIPEFAEYR